MSRPAKWIAIGLVLFLAVVVFLTLSLYRYEVEVCVEFNGRTMCRPGAGATREEALRTVMRNACAFLASGMTQSMACERAEPVRVRWIKE